ncbi:MAG: hypothetical protein IJA95_05380 [Bacteroidaceae bacterium]|nr:hypothetical protein [Bacteroides sp.]MBQ4588697.1 hypothetical protein [Bacteroidaceae bacterium]
MKKIISLSVLLVVVALYAFTKTSPRAEDSEITFPVTEELQGRVIPIDSVFFRYPYRLEVRGDRVVIEDLHGPDHFYHLFTFPEFRYLHSFGQRGEGPEEMQTVDDFRWDGQTLWALDNIKSELVRWELNGSRDKMVRTERIKLDKATFRALDIVPFQNNSFLIPNYSGDTRFCQVDRNGKLIKKWGVIPTDRKKDLQKYPYAFGYGWRSFIDYSPKTGILVAATQFGEVLEIWNVKKNTHKVMKGKLGEPEFEILPEYAIPAGAVGHNDIQVTDRAIYVIYRGISIKEEILARQKGKPLLTGGNTVRVFSLEGEPLKEYKLDHSVSGIWVDEQAGKMWALDVNSDEPLVEYSIK